MKRKIKQTVKKNVMSITYLMFGFIGVAIIGLLLFYSLSRVMINETLISTKQSVEQGGKYLEVYIENLKNISSLISENQDVVELFSHKGVLSDDQYGERIEQLIDSVLATDTSIKSIVIISKDGKVYSNEKQLDMSMSEDMMKEEWYVNAIHSDMPRLTSARMQSFSMDKDSWVISISKEIVDKEGVNIGVAVLDIPYKTIETYLMNLHLGDSGYAFILNSEDNIVFHQDIPYYQDEQIKQRLVELKNQKDGYSSENNTLVSQYQMNNTDWTLIGVCEVESITIIKRQITETILLGFAFILAGVILTTMILKKLTAELSQREEDIHKHEMDALYSQINPHFLYNTLDTIIWQAEFNQSNDVIQTTKSLAQFFRLSLNQGEKITTLRDEVEHVKQYLYIQKQRYQEKLNYSFQIDERLLEVYVPKIILQPIVENCIDHGIQELDTDGMITIRISNDEKELDEYTIEIEDNGVGFSYENKMDQLPQSDRKRLGGVGLQNVNQRIQLFCSEAYGLSIQSKEQEGTIVTLHMCMHKGNSL